MFFLFYQWVEGIDMKKEEFIYLWVNNYLRVSIQATIAIESYFNGTVTNFYDELHDSFNNALNAYEDAVKTDIEQTKLHAILIAYIVSCKEEQIEHALCFIEEILEKQSCVVEYDVREQYKLLLSQKKENPFLEVIKEIRLLEEKESSLQ